MPSRPARIAWHRRLALFLGVPALLLPAGAVAQEPGTPERAIVELRVGRLAGRTVEAWRRGDEALVPMDAFLALAEYRWRPAGNTLEVTWPRQRAPLRLAPGDTLVEVPGRGPVRLPPDGLLALDGTLAASVPTLEALFAVRLAVDWGELRIAVVDPASPPVADRLRREAARATLATGAAARTPPVQLAEQPGRLSGVVADWGMVLPGSGSAPSGTMALGAGLGRSAFEVLLATAHGPDGQRLEADASWTRVWQDRPWITQLRVGDLPVTGPRARQARGILLTNSPWLRPNRVGTLPFTGELGPGWLVESWRDGALVAWDSVDAFGRYAFDVPVQYGENPLDFVAYGPDGEVRPFSSVVRMSSRQLPDQDMEYGVSAGLCRRMACDGTANLDGRYGLSSRVTVGGGLEAAWGDSVSRPVMPYLTLSGTPVNAIGLELEYVAGGFTRAAAQFEPSGHWLVQGEAGWFADVRTPVLPTAGLRDQQVGRVLFRPQGLRGQNYVEAVAQRTSTLLGTRTVGRLGGSVQAAPGRLLPYVRVESGFGADAAWYGGFDSYLLPRASLGPVAGRIWARTRLEMAASGGLHEASLALVSPIGRQAANAEAAVRWQRDLGARFTLQVSAIFPWARAAATASAGRDGSAVYQTLSGSAVWDRPTGTVRTAPGPSLQRTGLSGTVFLDTDADGVQDADEPGMPGVRLVAGGRVTVTDSLGAYHAWDLPAFTPLHMEVDTLSLRDPLWVPARQAFRVVAGADGYRQVSLPLVPAAVLEGTVEWDGAPGLRAGLQLRIVNRDDGAVRTTRTFSDGSFYLMGLPPGRYRLEVARASLEEVHAVAEPALFEVTPEAALGGLPRLRLMLRRLP